MDTLRIIDPTTKQSVAWTWDQLREHQTTSQITGVDNNKRPVVTALNIDTTWYMEQGPGTYFNPELFSGVRETLSKSASSLNLQNGQSVSLSSVVAADKLTSRVSHYTTDINNETWDIRSLVWGGTSARITGNITNIDGSLYLTDYKIIPWNDNFNFYSDPENMVKTLFNATYRTFNGGTDRGVPLNFDGTKVATITKPYGIKEMGIDAVNNKNIFGIKSKNTLLNSLNNAADALKTNCFLAGTRIKLPCGNEVAIENVLPGDMVLSFDSSADPTTNSLSARRVTQVFSGITTTIINLRGLYCTPGHKFLNGSNDGDPDTTFIHISSALKKDGLIFDFEGNYIRARTGAKKGTLDDRPVRVSAFDPKQDREIIITVRAGIPILAELTHGAAENQISFGKPLYKLLESKDITIGDDGQLRTSSGHVFDAVDWPPNSTPFDTNATENWIVSTEDCDLYVPKWIDALPDPTMESASEQIMP